MRTMGHITDWPEGVLFRALTTNLAPIDITKHAHKMYRATCQGCGRFKTVPSPYSPSSELHPEVDEKLFVWADEHATVCRFLPRPEPEDTPPAPLKAI